MTDPKAKPDQNQKNDSGEDTHNTQEIKQIRPSHMNQGNRTFRPDPNYRPDSQKQNPGEQSGQKDTEHPESSKSRQAS
jgi:hypothetical protein